MDRKKPKDGKIVDPKTLKQTIHDICNSGKPELDEKGIKIIKKLEM